jgi:hypothetical protein
LCWRVIQSPNVGTDGAGFLLSSGTARVELAHDSVFSLSGTVGAAGVGGAAGAGYPKSAYCAAHIR